MSSQIHFFYEGITTFALPKLEAWQSWIEESLNSENQKLILINYIFCTDDYLLSINQDYLQHDTYTDIITFDNSEEDNQIEGDIFISLERVQENAVIHQQTLVKELARVMIHGVLHLIGYPDKTSQEAQYMRQKEGDYLSKLPDILKNLTLN